MIRYINNFISFVAAAIEGFRLLILLSSCCEV